MGLLMFFLFWVASVIIEKIIFSVGQKTRFQEEVFFLLGRSTRMAVFLTGVVVGLGVMGMDIPTIVASLGLTGFALGFALKDSLSNVLAGAQILIYKPFKVGSKIKAMGYEGQVVKIDLRYTSIHADSRRVLIPNSNLINNPVEIIHR